MADLTAAVRTVISQCLALKPGEEVVVVVDPGTRAIGEALRGAGELGPNLAELGLGTNERATLTGNILEDEKLLGTLHVAFGANAGIGGTVAVPIHLDTLVLEPALDVGGTRVLEGGRLVYEG